MAARPLRVTVPSTPLRPPGASLASGLTLLVASGMAQSRAELVRATGLARSTVSSCLDQLLAVGLLEEHGELARPTRGRPAQQLVLGRDVGVLLVVDVGVRSARMAVSDLAQRILAREEIPVDLSRGPVATLDLLSGRLMRLLQGLDLPLPQVRAVVLGLPAPVDVRRGVPVRPPILTGWDGFPVADTLQSRFRTRVLVDNDANLMALGEARALPSDQCPLLLIKVGTGIGGGLVTADGQLHHGTDGAAGDIGHVQVPGSVEVTCHCGNIGCVEAIASVRAISRRLALEHDGARGPETSAHDLEELLRRSDAKASALVKEAAAAIGGVVATMVHFYNPSRVVIAGSITRSTDQLLAGIRSVVYERALPLATRNLTLAHSVLGDNAGVSGGVVTGIERVLAADHIEALMAELEGLAARGRSFSPAVTR
jgi:predicted NBD/HSP70 family sugar kinase